MGSHLALAQRQRADLDGLIGALEADARDAWASRARARRWTLWVRLSWEWPVTESTALKQVERWAERLRSMVPGAAVLVGLHSHQARIHAHGFLFVPRRWSEPVYPPGVHPIGEPAWSAWVGWSWPYGQVWAQRYRPGRTARQHGAAEYTTKEPGTVVTVGTAPPYHPRRARSS